MNEPTNPRPTDAERRLLSRYLDGELDEVRRAELDALIDASEPLQAELAFWKRFRERLAESDETDASSTTSVADAVMATIHAHNREIAAVLPFVRRLSAAAAVVVVAAGAVLAALAMRPSEGAHRLDVRPGADLERSVLAPTGPVGLIGGPSVNDDEASTDGEGR